METCQYCGVRVEKGELGYHYAGFHQPPCPAVERAFGTTAHAKSLGEGLRKPNDPCVTCGEGQRMKNLSYCKECRNKKLAEYRLRAKAQNLSLNVGK